MLSNEDVSLWIAEWGGLTDQKIVDGFSTHPTLWANPLLSFSAQSNNTRVEDTTCFYGDDDFSIFFKSLVKH